MSMLDWVKKEVELAKIIEAKDLKEGEFDYGGACYDSALKAFESLTQDGHSGFSIGLTKNILNRLIDGKPLTPIEDIDEIWNEITHYNPEKGYANYQCTRMSSLFKRVYSDGRIEYNDINLCYAVNINNPDIAYHSNLVSGIVDELYPIKMPYIPQNDPIKVYCEQTLFSMENGDFDTVGIIYLIDPDGGKVAINRYFKEENRKWIEIKPEEYAFRYSMSRKEE